MLRRSSLWMGTLCATVGIGVGMWVASDAIGSGYAVLPVFSGAASFLSGWLCWRSVVARREAPHVRRAALAGVLAALLGHYLTFYLLILWGNVEYWLLGWPFGLLGGEPPGDPLNGLWGAGILALWSLLFFGWLTLPIGGLVGAALLVWLRRNCTRASGAAAA